MSRDWDSSSIDWEASRKAGGFVFMSSQPEPWPPRKPGPEYHAFRRAQRAIVLLRKARELLKDSPRTQARVRLALSSAKGAERHAYLRYVTSWNDIPPGRR
jgi:hypothetical protein